MNILFIVPLNEPFNTVMGATTAAATTKLNSGKKIKKLNCVFPSGVMSIAAYTAHHVPEAQIRILDFNVALNHFIERRDRGRCDYPFEAFLQDALSLIDFVPDIVGISALFTTNYEDLTPLGAYLRERYEQSLVVCGGHLPTTLYERLYRHDPVIDALAFGEGEIPFMKLVTAMLAGEAKEYLALSPSWITREKLLSEPKTPFLNTFIDDLDQIPPLDLDMLVFPDAYFESSKYLFLPEQHDTDREIILHSTRGCPHNCIFCASHQVHGKTVRMYSAERVKSDIMLYNSRYGITKFVFHDDHFLFRKKRALDILEFIADQGLVASIITPAFFSIDAEVASAMKRAGIRSVMLTIETGNENTFKNIIRKPSSLKKANEAVELLHREGINVCTNILIGLPGETKDCIDSCLEYLLTTSFNWYMCYVTAPLPGSELYRICHENEYFATGEDILLMDFKRCVIRTRDFSPEYIESKAYEMNLRLNFINNYDMRSGNYQTALMLFEKIIHSVIDTHAFAYHFAAKCCEELQLEEKRLRYSRKYREIVAEHPFWKEWAEYFQLPDAA